MCPAVFVGIEGFTLPEQYIAKEVTLLFENNEFTHVLLAPPLGYSPTTKEMRAINYTTKYLHGIPYTEGDMPHAKFNVILSRLNQIHTKLYTTAYIYF